MYKYFYVAFLAISLFSCSKKDGVQESSRTELLVNKKWQVVAMRLTIDSVTKNIFSSYPDYLKDDYYIFKSDFAYELNDNSIKDPLESSDILDTGTWQLTNADNDIELKSNDPYSSAYPTTILELTGNMLKVKTKDSERSSTVTTLEVIK